MKKIVIKLMLVFALIIPTISFALESVTLEVAAKISGDYAYDLIDDTTIQITNYNGDDVEVNVPAKIDGYTVTKIGYGAFAECKSIQKVTLPDTLKTIDYYAFSQCSQLREIVFPNSIIALGRYAFAGCHSLESVVVPEKIKSLGYGVFFDCINLKNVTLPEGLESIGGIAFGSCRSLENIELPSNLQSIDGNAFNDCTSLQSITLPNSVKSIGSGVFLGCLSLKEVSLPETLVGIGQNAFQNCISLESIYIPESVSGIGYGAFTGCVALKEINIPSNVSALGNAMFSGCSSLERIDIPATVTSIGDFTFSGCTNLKSIDLPNSVTSIGASAFQSCSNLQSIQLPKNIKIIETNLFRYCDKLENVIIPNGVTQVNATAFADCVSLQSVTFPNTITQNTTGDANIGSRIFSNSPNVVASVIEGSLSHKYMVRTAYKYRLLQNGMNFNKDTLSIKVNESSRLSVLLAPYTIVDNTLLKWSSSNASVASVDANGVVSGVGVGEAVISASNANGQKVSCLVQVNNDVVEIAAISLNKTNTSMRINTTDTLRATINPISTTQDRTLQWSSSNSDVVLVSSTGSITAVQPGNATITVRTSNGLSATCDVSVTSEIVSLTLNKTAMVLESGVEQSLRATINPSNTTDAKDITWKSSNTNVATVSGDGNVIALNEGYATITATSVNGKKAECKISVVKPVEQNPIISVSLNKNKLDLEVSENETLVATINPENTSEDKTLTWSSSNPSVASVDQNGKVNGLTSGKTTITVTTSNGKQASCEVNVRVSISSVTLSESKVELEVNADTTLVATINPENTSEDKTLTWSSSDPSVASVDQNGKVSGLTSGKTTITVTTSNGKKAVCEVNVIVSISNVTLNKEIMSLRLATSETLVATINPENTSGDKTLTWTSSNPNVASVDQNGKVIALSLGESTIHVTTSNGKVATCVVRVFDVNKDELRALIEEANKKIELEYTKDSFAQFKNALIDAQKVVEDEEAMQPEVQQVMASLRSAMDSLVLAASAQDFVVLSKTIEDCIVLENDFSAKDFVAMKQLITQAQLLLAQEANTVSKESVQSLNAALQSEYEYLVVLKAHIHLTNTVQEANAVLKEDLSDVDPVAVEELKDCIAQAMVLLNDENATAQQMNDASEVLLKAIEKAQIKVNKSALALLVEELKEYNESAFTQASWKVFISAYNEAQNVLASTNVTQIEVDSSYSKLVNAKEQLVSRSNKVALVYNITFIEDILNNKTKYVASTIRNLSSLLLEANKVNEKADSTQIEIDAMNEKLIKALLNVRLKPN